MNGQGLGTIGVSSKSFALVYSTRSVLEYMGYGDNHGVSYFHCTSLSHTRESRIDPTFHIRSCFPVEINCIVNFPLLMWLFEYSCTSVVCRTREYIITYMLSLLMLVSDTFTGTVVPNIVVCRTRLSDTSTK